jgi:hypothetical protein
MSINKERVTATIALNGTLSAAVDLNGVYLYAIQMPAAWDAGGITLQLSQDNDTFVNVYDSSGNEISLTVSTSRLVLVRPSQLIGDGWLKVRSGTAGTPVTQTAARSLVLLTRPL